MFCINLNPFTDQKKLLKYVHQNNAHKIKQLIIKHPDLLQFEDYQPPIENNNILIIACNDHMVTGATLRTLIELGADLASFTKNDRWEAIHYATINSDKEKLSVILEFLTTDQANSLVHCSSHISKKFNLKHAQNVKKSLSNNALHVLLKYAPKNSDFRQCCEMLIKKGVDVHHADSNGVTPLDLLKKIPEMEDLLYEHERYPPKGQFKNLLKLVKSRCDSEVIISSEFKDQVNDIDGPCEELSSCTLLQMCVAKGLTSWVDALLKLDADPNKTIPKNPKFPIMIAIKEDYEEIVELLLAKPGIQLPKDILITMQIKHKHIKNLDRVDKYMQLVLKHLRQFAKETIQDYFLATDSLQRTALHYATMYRSPEVILDLLSLGAPLTKRDLFGDTPLRSIEPQVMERFLDNCINIPKDAENMQNMMYALHSSKHEFPIEINYDALTFGNEESQVHESEFLFYLTKIKKLTPLINHPVIYSYLFVKWNRFRWTVYINLLLYLIAYASFFFYGFFYKTYTDVSNILLLTSIIILFLREIVQILIYRSDYIKRVDSLINLLLIAGVAYIIAAGWYEEVENHNLRVGFSVVFLTSTLGIFLQLGILPYFTIKVIVLRQTAVSFFKYMVFYIFPVLAFFFCFYMLNEEAQTSDLFFETLYDVATMFAGDPDAGYPAKYAGNPIFSHIIYVCFIVLIGIILQNLLIGLAVSDLQEIHKEAVFIDTKERASYITNLERVIFTQFLESKSSLFRNLLEKLLYSGSVFGTKKVLVIQPYNKGCVYVKDYDNTKLYNMDPNIIIKLQDAFKNLTLDKDKNFDSVYLLKNVCERLEKLELLLNKLSGNKGF